MAIVSPLQPANAGKVLTIGGFPLPAASSAMIAGGSLPGPACGRVLVAQGQRSTRAYVSRRLKRGVWSAMLEDRNWTSHPYTQRLAGRSTNASRAYTPSLDRLSVRVQIDRCRSAGASAMCRR